MQCFFLIDSAIFGVTAPYAVGLSVTRLKILPLRKAERSTKYPTRCPQLCKLAPSTAAPHSELL